MTLIKGAWLEIMFRFTSTKLAVCHGYRKGNAESKISLNMRAWGRFIIAN